MDLARLSDLLNGDAGVNIDVLMRKQAPEADLICLTKADQTPDSITLELDYGRCPSGDCGISQNKPWMQAGVMIMGESGERNEGAG